jgi:hypothetical protein
LLLCISTVGRLWRLQKWVVCQTKDAERRDKLSVRTGKDTWAQARPVKTFRKAGDVEKGTAGL